MKTLLQLFFSIIIAMFLVSCSSLKSEHYVGELASFANEKVKDVSVWEFDDEIFFVNVVDSSTLVASTMEWNETKKEHVIIRREIILTELKEDPHAYFLNLKEGNENLYTILLLAPTLNERDYLVHTINKDTIKKHIKEGKIKAVKQGGDFILNLSKEELDQYISKNFYTLFSSGAGIIKAMDCNRIFK